MEQNQTEQLLRQPIAPKLTQNLEQIRTIAEGSSDLLVNEFVLSGLPAALLCCEGMLATSIITELILNPITKIALECPTAANVFDTFKITSSIPPTGQRQKHMPTSSGFSTPVSPFWCWRAHLLRWYSGYRAMTSVLSASRPARTM